MQTERTSHDQHKPRPYRKNRKSHLPHSQRKGDAGSRFGIAVRRRDKDAQPGSEEKSEAIPIGFYVSTYTGRGRSFEVPNWHLKDWERWQTFPPLRVHGTGRGNAFDRAEQRTRYISQHRNHARVRNVATHACIQRRTRSPSGRTRKQVRQELPSRV